MGRVSGRTALVTGAALGQGRAHAVRLAEEGANLILVDLLRDHEAVPYPMGTEADLATTVALAEAHGAKVAALRADVADRGAMRDAVAEGESSIGPIDIVVANAGVCPRIGPFWEISDDQWTTVFDINVRGVWNTVSAVAPAMIERGTRGSVIVTSSLLGLKGSTRLADYSAAKHAVIGLMRSMAMELAPHMIRVNALCPNSVDTNMINNEYMFGVYRPDLENPTRADTVEGFKSLGMMPVPWVEPVDIANAMLFLASDETRYVTGVALPVDFGGKLR